ncbi:MAG: AhpC/TSA family protein [Proteiniphilum sp.]|jgi:peroxiredoxin|nr:AhpC/TSA family protein [Proteiniphilum sp.]
MKKIIYLFIMAAVVLSCQNSKEYAIDGSIADEAYEGTQVFMQQMTEDAMIPIDTAVVQNGKFTFSGVADTTMLRFILLDESVNPRQESRIPVLIEPGKLKVTFDSVVTVKGSKVNEAYTDLRLKQRDLGKNIREVVERYNTAMSSGTMNDSLDAEINEAYEEINNQMTDLNFNFIRDNIKNDLGKYSFMASSSMFEPEKQKEILSLADDDFKAQENIQRVVKRLENLENVAIGKKFVDFTLKNTEGNDVSLSDYAGKGKYVLVDFWAAWCGPCRQEMPNVVAAYDKYKSKGFEVVGVSFDQEKDKWIQGISDLNMTWPQMSDLMYWESPVVDMYAINGIPHTVLLDKEGTIIEKNLRGEALDAKLAELMP